MGRYWLAEQEMKRNCLVSIEKKKKKKRSNIRRRDFTASVANHCHLQETPLAYGRQIPDRRSCGRWSVLLHNHTPV